ncbi:unnamed protein product, partial [Oppiella nova]
TFRDSYIPTIEDTYRQVISCNKNVCTLQITDTTGSHQFPAMQRLNITKGHAFMLVYSITSKQSLEELIPTYREIIEVKAGEENLPIMLVGNKSDEDNQREQSLEELIPTYREIIEVKAGEENLPIMLVGNKSDEDNQREVNQEYANEMVSKILKGCGFIETSAKTGQNVHEAFQLRKH